MKYIELKGEKYYDIDEALAMCRRHPQKLQPVLYEQALASRYTHLEVWSGYWIPKEYEVWLRAYMDYFMSIPEDGTHSLERKSREDILEPFLKALLNGGVPHMEWCKTISPTPTKRFSINIITKEAFPKYFDNKYKIKCTLSSSHAWNIETYNTTVIKTLKSIHKDNLVIHSTSPEVLAFAKTMHIRNYERKDSLNNRPTFFEVSKYRELGKALKEIYNWDNCLILK